jgi:RimJ/RimL family protein N-acetyltransferase
MLKLDLTHLGYWVIRQNEIVGTGSFVGQPQNQLVEIAYWTFKAFEGQGIASFACAALVKIAHDEDQNLTITAKTAPNFNTSTTILQKTSSK